MFNYLKVRKNLENLNSWITQMSNKPSARKKKKNLKYGWAIFYLLSSPCLPSEKMWDKTVPKRQDCRTQEGVGRETIFA